MASQTKTTESSKLSRIVGQTASTADALQTGKEAKNGTDSLQSSKLGKNNIDSVRYSKWGRSGVPASFTSLEANSVPLQKAESRTSDRRSDIPCGLWPTKEEILEELYDRQARHGLSDSCSTESYTDSGAGSRYQIRYQRLFSQYSKKESIKRSGFYGACTAALILSSLFAVGLAVGLPLILKKLSDLDERLKQIEHNSTPSLLP